MNSLNLPTINSSSEGWGPLHDWCPESFKELNIGYAPYSKLEKLGKAADWTNLGRTFTGRQTQGASLVSPFEEDEAEFFIVDSRTTQKSTSKKGYGPRSQVKVRQRTRGGAHWQDQQIRSKGRTQVKQQTGRGRGGRGAAGGGYRRGGGVAGGWTVQHQRKTSTSVDIEPAWNDPVSVIDFNNLVSASSDDLPEVQSLATYGAVKKYNNAFDKLLVRQERPLERGWAAEMKFYHPSTSDDPVMMEFAQKKVANVFVTDSILVVLMSVLRSAYAFDIIITKDAEGNIFLDKRDDFLFDYLSVNENSNEPPFDEAELPCNSVEPLHKEATTANYNFSQQVLLKEGEGIENKLANPNPFGSQTDHLPSVGYNYKTFDLGDNTKICVRTEYDAFEITELNRVEKTRNILIKSLNEYDQKVTGGWRMKLENQKAGCFATELKSNNCKLSRWVFQAHLSNVTNIKLGWISRTNPKDPYLHSILAVTDHPMKEIQSELGIDFYQVWGSLKYVLNVLQKHPEGSYILIRDPNRKNVYVYKTSPNEFRKGAK